MMKELSQVEGMTIDFKAAVQRFKDEDAVHQLLDMFVDSFPKETKALEIAYTKRNDNAIKAVTHRLKGGSSYCSTTRLQAICDKLELAMRKDDSNEIDVFYNLLLLEIEAITQIVKFRNT
ncbi:MAG TPA: Hpt domain-containing protein [Gammaproteobacteria bacterium]|jgi:HPt (histidine-containing phosphotransfer) domain-containing protein|nr:Hpt domain-containing protein [Gammaproteobacteria bacterium]